MLSLENPIQKTADDLLHRIAMRLDQLGFRVRNFRIAPDQGLLILHGRVRTYYCKQMIQQIAMEVSGCSVMSNDIEVE